jgi:hypothetical protein
MTTLALIAGYEKLRDNEKVCKFCEITQCLTFITFPIALPFFIIAITLSNY